MCGASYLYIHDQDDKEIHPDQNDLKIHESNIFINIVQNRRWSCHLLLSLIENCTKIYQQFEKDDAEVILKEYQQILMTNDDSVDRSLIQEFVNHDHSCLLSLNQNIASDQFPQLLTVKDLEDVIENNFKDCGGDFLFDKDLICGVFKVTTGGQFVVCDNHSSLNVFGDFEGCKSGDLFQLQSLKVTTNLGKRILIVKKFKVLANCDKVCDMIENLSIDNQRGINVYSILARSMIIKDSKVDKNEHYFYIMCLNQVEERITFRIKDIDNYFRYSQNSAVDISQRKLSLLNNDQFNICKFYGSIPVFDAEKENIKILYKAASDNLNAKESSTYDDLKDIELIPNEEPITLTGIVRDLTEEYDGNNRKLKMTIFSKKSRECFPLYLSPRMFSCLPGLKYEIQSIVKITSKKNNPYFISTPFTNFVPIEDDEDNNEEGSDFIDTIVSVEAVTSCVVAVACGGCGSGVVHGHCSYIGCGVRDMMDHSVRLVTSLLCGDKMVTGVASNEEDVIALLGCSRHDWDEVKTQAMTEGRLTVKSCPLLSRLVSNVTSQAGYCCVKGRLVDSRDVKRKMNDFNEEGRERMFDSTDATLFCLKAWRPSTCELNILYEQMLDR